ncbi:hypothetical protein GCM10010981_33400 [Dyella nitratireducens]|uniref:Uncharacterized protein n=1 Tax=Dyella nitratireducens TaxID=1849580 RepID=A0ABQ1GE19_9GAMM|nr:hypothetical protein GCM10010981_33400 [Dyella nitratireducens]
MRLSITAYVLGECIQMRGKRTLPPGTRKVVAVIDIHDLAGRGAAEHDLQSQILCEPLPGIAHLLKQHPSDPAGTDQANRDAPPAWRRSAPHARKWHVIDLTWCIDNELIHGHSLYRHQRSEV